MERKSIAWTKKKYCDPKWQHCLYQVLEEHRHWLFKESSHYRINLKKISALRCSVISDSLQPHGLYVTCQAPLSMGTLQARILGCVAMSFSRGSSQPRDRSRVSCIAGEAHLRYQRSTGINSMIILFKRDPWKEESQIISGKGSYIPALSPASWATRFQMVILESLVALISKIPYNSLIFIVSNLLLIFKKGFNDTFRLDVTGCKYTVVFLN